MWRCPQHKQDKKKSSLYYQVRHGFCDLLYHKIIMAQTRINSRDSIGTGNVTHLVTHTDKQTVFDCQQATPAQERLRKL